MQGYPQIDVCSQAASLMRERVACQTRMNHDLAVPCHRVLPGELKGFIETLCRGLLDLSLTRYLALLDFYHRNCGTSLRTRATDSD